MNTTIQTEAVEVCPFCDQENVYPNWDVNKQGYVARCQHCGKLIMLCDEATDRRICVDKCTNCGNLKPGTYIGDVVIEPIYRFRK